MSLFKALVTILLGLAFSTTALAAGTAVPTENDPVAQKRAVDLTEQLRCLVCQNQSIAESNADLALDLRRQVREQIAAGRTDQQIIDYMVARYGDFVLYKPPLRASTVLLWAGPGVLLLAGLVLLIRHIRSRRSAGDAPQLSEEDQARAAELLAGTPQRASR